MYTCSQKRTNSHRCTHGTAGWAKVFFNINFSSLQCNAGLRSQLHEFAGRLNTFLKSWTISVCKTSNIWHETSAVLAQPVYSLRTAVGTAMKVFLQRRSCALNVQRQWCSLQLKNYDKIKYRRVLGYRITLSVVFLLTHTHTHTQ